MAFHNINPRRSPGRAFDCRASRTVCLLMLYVLSCSSVGCSWANAFSQKQLQESQVLAGRARSAEQAGQHQQAEQLLLTAIDKNPNDGDLRWQLARSYMNRGDSNQALLTLKEAAEVQPENMRVYELWAQILIDNGHYDKALVPLTMGLRRDPEQIDLRMMKGQCEEKIEHYQQAFDSYQKVVHLSPNHGEALMRMAQIHIHWGKPNQAASLLRNALQNSDLDQPSRAEAFQLLGIVYGQEHRWNDAVSALKASAKLKDSLSADESYRLAYAEYQAGEIAAATDRAMAILETDRSHEQTRLLLKTLRLEDASAGFEESGVIQTSFEDDLIPPSGW